MIALTDLQRYMLSVDVLSIMSLGAKVNNKSFVYIEFEEVITEFVF